MIALRIVQETIIQMLSQHVSDPADAYDYDQIIKKLRPGNITLALVVELLSITSAHKSGLATNSTIIPFLLRHVFALWLPARAAARNAG